MTTDTTWQEGLAEQRAAEADTPRAWLIAATEEDRQKREQDRQEACRAFSAEAETEGYCLRCWARSTNWGLFLDKPKKIKHRSKDNCPNRNRRGAQR